MNAVVVSGEEIVCAIVFDAIFFNLTLAICEIAKEKNGVIDRRGESENRFLKSSGVFDVFIVKLA